MRGPDYHDEPLGGWVDVTRLRAGRGREGTGQKSNGFPRFRESGRPGRVQLCLAYQADEPGDSCEPMEELPVLRMESGVDTDRGRKRAALMAAVGTPRLRFFDRRSRRKRNWTSLSVERSMARMAMSCHLLAIVEIPSSVLCVEANHHND